MFTFKLRGKEFKPERLNGKQIAAGLLYYFFGISTKTYRTTRTTRANDWKKHAERMQADLDAERAAGLVLSGLNDQTEHKVLTN